jgi:hypothetical protein
MGRPSHFVIGPDNVVRNADVAIAVQDTAVVTLTRNDLAGNGTPLWFQNPPFSAPTLTSVSRTHVSGTCPVDGQVEVFAGTGDGPGRFLGEVPCTVAEGFSAAISEASGTYVSVSLTSTEGATGPFSEQRAIP